MLVELQEDEVFVVFKALHWYKDKISNREKEHRNLVEEDTILWLQDKLKELLEQELYVGSL
jgi:hypothetical protein